MKKLIKLSDTHYIVVDNSEIKEGDKFYCITNKVIFTAHTIEYLEEYNKLEDSNHNFYVNSKKVINAITNELFSCARKAWEKYHKEQYCYNYFMEMVRNKKPNKTNFKYL